MPRKERSVMEERMRFVLRLKNRESMASLCREFGISRVTGYKIYDMKGTKNGFGYVLRKDLHFQKENQPQHFSCRSSCRHQRSSR